MSGALACQSAIRKGILTLVEPGRTHRQGSQAEKVQKSLESQVAVPRGGWGDVLLEGLHPRIQDA